MNSPLRSSAFDSEDRKYYEARRLDRAGKEAEALQAYEAFLEGPLPADDPLRVSAAKRRLSLRGEGNFGDRFEQKLAHFFHQASDPLTLVPMLVGGTVFQAGRLACLGYLARTPASWLSRGIGAKTLSFALPFLAETSAFAGTSHGLRAYFDPAGSSVPFHREWTSAALSLGLLKFSGAIGGSLARPLQKIPSRLPSQALEASSLVGGLFLAGRLEERLGWREKSKASDALLDSLFSAASLSLGARLSHGVLGSSFSRPLGELEIRMQRSDPPSLGKAWVGWAKPALVEGSEGIEAPARPLWMSASEGNGSGKMPSEGLLEIVKKMGRGSDGLNAYLLIEIQSRLQALNPTERSIFQVQLDRLMGAVSAPERKAILPAWWQTAQASGPAEFGERMNHYIFWLKNLPAEEIPVLAESLLKFGERVTPDLMSRMAALSLKRALTESRRSLEGSTWVLPLFERMGKSTQNGLLRNIREQLTSEEIGISRKALDLLAALAPQLGTARLISWARDLLRQAPAANTIMQNAIWKGVQAMVEQIPPAERRRLLPALREALTADHGQHPSPFLFITLGKTIDLLDSASSNLLTRELLVHLTKTSPGMVKGLLVCFYERLERFSTQNRELLIQQLEALFDAADPALRSALLVETSHFRDLWKKLDPIEQATLLHRWEKGLAGGDPETTLRQAENLLFTSPTFRVEEKIELFLKLDEKAMAETTPRGLRRELARKLQKMGEELLPEEKALLITNSRSRRPSQNPLPLAGYLLRGLSHPEAPALAAALGLNASDWPLPVPRSGPYQREFAEWQEKVLDVLREHTGTPQIEPVELDLGQVLPIHHVFRTKDSDDFRKTVNEMRERIFRSLILDGWRPGQMPSAESLREAMTSTDLHHDNHPPFVGTATASGFSLLVDGHHRLSSLITLVADNHLPPEVLGYLPFDRAYQRSSQGILDAALDRSKLPSYGWKDVLAFHPASVELIESLGYTHTIDRAFR